MQPANHVRVIILLFALSLSTFNAAAQNVYSWRDAGRHVGENANVEGKIVQTRNIGKVCYLNFDPDYRKYISIVIFSDNFNRFPQSPENYYKNKYIRVSGNITEYQGRAQIIVDEPAQITIATPPPSAAPAAQNPAPSASPAAQSAPSAQNPAPSASPAAQSTPSALSPTPTQASASPATPAQPAASSTSPAPSIQSIQSIQSMTPAPSASPAQPAASSTSPAPSIQSIQSMTPAPSASPATFSDAPFVPWNEAHHHIGQTIQTRGKIIRTRNIGFITFLNFSTEIKKHVTLVIYEENYGAFPEAPEKLFNGKTVLAAGEVSTYKGDPQIVIHAPRQIRIIDDAPNPQPPASNY